MSMPPTSEFEPGDDTSPFHKPPNGPRKNLSAYLILGAAVVLLLVVIGVVVANGNDSPQAPAAASTVTVERTVPSTTSSSRPSTTAPSSVDAAPQSGVMPNVICMNLQAAQDLIQKTGVFYSRSRDASGQGRAQIFDRNWIVVSQSPAAGERIGEGDAVLSVVKTDEPNQC